MTGKEQFDNIEIPAGLSEIIQDARRRARTKRHGGNVRRGSIVTAAACAAVLITANYPGAASAMSDVPVLGQIVKLLQIGGGGERTDGVSVTTRAHSDTLDIHFAAGGDQTSAAPAYTVQRQNGPDRLIFTFNGVRNLNPDQLEADIRTLAYVKDVYRDIILDDSAIRFVVELKDHTDYTATEFKQPGMIRLSLFPAENAPAPNKLYFIRSQEMKQGESLAILEEQYAAEGSSVVKTRSGSFAMVIGSFATQADADAVLEKLKARDDYTEPLTVDSWMGNEHPQ
ncbi:AMIN domain-containing protein [Paenibacillus sp. XY044]|uniref:AMIN domain-containing protein n=1 Tax=Paenibacillus sp. XY044 TaxID=2026089 RepID=UPI000B997E18|nr:AMIN domain-containing protein [Paenibacillus sp. XY044]OZB95030.1 hypothetical protein CJP46_15110 [Paenibacillus sp. XY044]